MGNCMKQAKDIKKKGNQNGNKQTKTNTKYNANVQIWEQQLACNRNLQFHYPSSIEHKSFRQIEKDVNRTFPQSPFFNEENNKEKFRQVLRKFAVYFPKTGYTQGINFIVGFFLMCGLGMDQTFTLFVRVCTHSDLMCLGLYEDEFPLNRLYCSITWALIREKRIRLAQKMQSLNLIDQIWIFQWFMTFFIYSFPLEVIPEILSFIFTDKKFSFPKIATSLILELELLIMKCQNQFDFLELLDSIKQPAIWAKNMSIQKVISVANSIANADILKLLENLELDHNFYAQYFIMKQADRTVKYMQITNRQIEQRKSFLKNPDQSEFVRDDQHVSVLDSIEHEQMKRMFQSVDERDKMEKLKISKKLWQSDLQKLKS